ncbi:type 1 glutamine amidotransferase [Rhodobacteraceae bacterium RKSG542]|uniref:type 1 glutamine amidotransferase n=1 Tax=Pseudovibrio flavus TaxID=2529854 RepID=UPI0012BB6D21|nr:type 1 glutamine amidotransferase [Pseudovibrio flavus]MTI18233.1 type 1 glutamine amidotransferase [Pseudovibrio flavus]
MAAKSLSVGIIETGRPPEELGGAFGDYPQMVQSWLGEIPASYKVYAVLDGVLPTNPADADLWVITGSKFGVYEDHEWIAPLEVFIRECASVKQPMVGICFGHQLIAQAMGGLVKKSDKGWGLGVHDYPSTEEWPVELGAKPEQISIQAYHQDQVLTKPETAVTIASSDFCEFAALWYPDFAITVQGHPEFSKPFTSALIESRRGTILSDAIADSGQESMAKTVNREQLGLAVKSFMKV